MIHRRASLIVLVVALGLFGSRVPLATALDEHCGSGGLHWGPTIPLGAVNGVEFLFAVTMPQCAGDQQVFQIIVHNPTDHRVQVRFGIEFTSVGGLRERAPDGSGPVTDHFMGNERFQDWTPFRDHFGVVPDPTLVLEHVRLLDISVCPDPMPAAGPGAAYSSCGHTGNTIERGVPCPDAPTDARSGYSPLMLAARTRNTALLAGLVACGSNVNARATDGYTALMFAANSGVLANAELLLKAGAQVNARQDSGLTSLGIVDSAFPEMSALLQRYGATR